VQYIVQIAKEVKLDFLLLIELNPWLEGKKHQGEHIARKVGYA